MTSTAPLIAAILARLATIPDHDVHDGAPPDRTPNGQPYVPPRRYLSVYDQTGNTTTRKWTGRGLRIRVPIQVSCVARTTTGARDSAAAVRALLDGWAPLPDADPLLEVGTAPVLTDGPTGDTRITQPLTFVTTITA